jgi:hypothetical protein
METRDTWRQGHGDIKRKTEAQVVFLHPFTICLLCIQKVVVCPFVDEETNRSYPFAKGLNGLAQLVTFIVISNSCITLKIAVTV